MSEIFLAVKAGSLRTTFAPPSICLHLRFVCLSAIDYQHHFIFALPCGSCCKVSPDLCQGWLHPGVLPDSGSAGVRVPCFSRCPSVLVPCEPCIFWPFCVLFRLFYRRLPWVHRVCSLSLVFKFSADPTLRPSFSCQVKGDWPVRSPKIGTFTCVSGLPIVDSDRARDIWWPSVDRVLPGSLFEI